MADDPLPHNAAPPPAARQSALLLAVPPNLTAALTALESQTSAIAIHTAARELRLSLPDTHALAPEFQHGARAERLAFLFGTHRAPADGPWGTYFQPMMSGVNNDGTPFNVPDLANIDAEVLAHWAARSRTAKHPSLVARYSDLVWDLVPIVTKAKRPSDAIEYARQAIDSYIAASRLDDGSAWSDTRDNLGRSLQIAMQVNDVERISQSAAAHIAYVDRTCEDDKVGTYCYLFDNLIPKGKALHLDAALEDKIIAMFEAKLAALAVPAVERDPSPFATQSVGMRLAAYYARKSSHDDRIRVIRSVAEAFERCAAQADALSRVMLIEHAREHYLMAGLREEADRVQIEAEKILPEATKSLGHIQVTHDLLTSDVDNFLNAMVSGGLDVALQRFTFRFIPNPESIAAQAESNAKRHPLSALISARPIKLGEGHIEADVGDSSGDPDGLMVYRTAEAMQFQVPWISWTLDRLMAAGLTADFVVSFVENCPLFRSERIALIQRGIHAHFLGDYPQAIHVLIPQIEHAVVSLTRMAGMATTKPHRTGRGVMQMKNLNDVLPRHEWPVRGDYSENLRMYLLSALAHPKGFNIRNDVCHGLWPASRFSLQVSERVLHVLLSIALVRPRASGEEGEGTTLMESDDERGDALGS